MKCRIATLATAITIAATGVAAPVASAQIGLTGGGNCSLWAKMKSAAFGVACEFYMDEQR